MAKLKARAEAVRQPLILVVQADEDVKSKVFVRLGLVARAAGVKEMVHATRPPLVPGVRSEGP